MIEVPETVESTPGQLVYCEPNWQDMQRVLDIHPGKVVDLKTQLFQLAGKIRAYVVQHGDATKAYRADCVLAELWFHAPEVAIQSYLNRVRHGLETQLNHVKEVEAALEALRDEGKI